MRSFDYSFLKRYPVDAGLFSTALNIGTMSERSRTNRTNYPKAFDKLEAAAKMQSVKESNEIDGITVSDAKLRSLMDRTSAPSSQQECIIAGYRNALETIYDMVGNNCINEDTLKEIHRKAVSFTNEKGGEYRTRENLTISINYGGNKEVRFSPRSTENPPEYMEKLMLALQDALGDPEINRLLLIPCFIIDFMSIHPFEDGNGRMSRLLTALLFYESGINVGRYISFDAKLNASRMDYYRIVQESSVGWSEGTNDYLPFIRFYMNTLLACYTDLDSRFHTDEGRKMGKSERIEATVLGSDSPISKKEIMQRLPDVSQTTIESVLYQMLTDGKIEKIGANRSAKYRRL